MTDIVERLRSRIVIEKDGPHMSRYVPDIECRDAADEIERLREALRPFDKAAKSLLGGAYAAIGLTEDDFSRVRSIFAEDKSDER